VATFLSQLGRGGGVCLRVLLFLLQDGARKTKSRGGRHEHSSVGAHKGKGGAKQSGRFEQPPPKNLFSRMPRALHSSRTRSATYAILTRECPTLSVMPIASGSLAVLLPRRCSLVLRSTGSAKLPYGGATTGRWPFDINGVARTTSTTIGATVCCGVFQRLGQVGTVPAGARAPTPVPSTTRLLRGVARLAHDGPADVL
jgi:hypothetical protein